MSTRAGCSSGDLSNAAYRNRRICAEVIGVIFNAYQTTYRDLLGFFFRIHDATTLNRQENCAGS